MRRLIIPLLIVAFVLSVVAVGYVVRRNYRLRYARLPLARVGTLAGARLNVDDERLKDPFGIVSDGKDLLYVSDGDTNRIWQVNLQTGARYAVTSATRTPSQIALAANGDLIVAESGAHIISRINIETGARAIIAGLENQAGYKDGSAAEARFAAPVGVAVGKDGAIYVADTYNDRIRVIETGGNVRTLAGGGNKPAYRDAANGTEARFDTPCGLAIRADGTLLVADAGNGKIRLVTPAGAVSTLNIGAENAAANANNDSDKLPLEPLAVAVDADGSLLIADFGSSAILKTNAEGKRLPFIDRQARGLADGALAEARLSQPSGVAVTPNGTVFIADTGNGLVRVVHAAERNFGAELNENQRLQLKTTPAEFRKQGAPRWPFAPPERPREIAATVGELRGEVPSDKGIWFHNGLDVPGGYGETVRAVRREKVLRPLAVENVGTAREFIRLPAMGYIHVRIGRDANDKPFDDARFSFVRNERGAIERARVMRGAEFDAGDALGTLNNQNHVHLIAGASGGEMNALAALELPGIKDTVAPAIEKVEFFKRNWETASGNSASAGKNAGSPVVLQGDTRIVVTAYDQMDGNAARRRLGLYRVGYQVLQTDGQPLPGFAEPRWNISFETLPDNAFAAPLVYAPGSMSGYTPQTIFGYIATNFVRDREAREEFWRTNDLPNGEYLARVLAEDFFGNRSQRDTRVRINN